MQYLRKMSKLDIISLVVSVVIWVLVLYIMYDLVLDFWKSGRKEKTSVTQTKHFSIESPSIAMITPVGPNCVWKPVMCLFTPMQKDDVSDPSGVAPGESNCLSCFTNATFLVEGMGFPASVFNGECLTKMGYMFHSQLDEIDMAFAAVNMSGHIVTNDSVCYNGPGEERSSAILLPADKTAMANQQTGATPKTEFVPPLYVAHNHFAPIGFKLSQEEDADGHVVNTTHFSAMQYTIPRHLRFDPDATLISASIFASSFSVQRIVHTNGETILGLLGGMFGWIGVWTGACVQGLIFSMMAIYKARQTNHEDVFKYEEDTLSTTLREDMRSQFEDLQARVASMEIEMRGMRKDIFTV